MSASSRDQRVSLFSYSNTGTDGIVSTVYTFTATRWARKEVPTGRELMLGEASEHKVDAVFTFAEEVSIPVPGLLRHGSHYYEVRSVLPRRATREQHVLAEAVDVAQQSYTVVGP